MVCTHVHASDLVLDGFIKRFGTSLEIFSCFWLIFWDVIECVLSKMRGQIEYIQPNPEKVAKDLRSLLERL